MAVRKASNPRYERIADKAKRGEYSLVEPLDYMIIGWLHDEGALFAGLYPLGETVKNLLTKFNPEQRKHLTSETIASRLKLLRDQGLVIDKESGAGKVWQRTEQGKTIHRNWEASKNGNTHS